MKGFTIVFGLVSLAAAAPTFPTSSWNNEYKEPTAPEKSEPSAGANPAFSYIPEKHGEEKASPKDDFPEVPASGEPKKSDEEKHDETTSPTSSISEKLESGSEPKFNILGKVGPSGEPSDGDFEHPFSHGNDDKPEETKESHVEGEKSENEDEEKKEKEAEKKAEEEKEAEKEKPADDDHKPFPEEKQPFLQPGEKKPSKDEQESTEKHSGYSWRS